MGCKGFSLLETIVAFIILSIFMMMVINAVVQDSVRAHKITDTYDIISVAENAISEVKLHLSDQRINNLYQGTASTGYTWQAAVIEDDGSEKNNTGISTKHTGRSRINLYIHDSNKRQRLHIETIFFAGNSL